MKHARFIAVCLALALMMLSAGNAFVSSCPIGCDLCTGEADCPTCSFCIAVTATARPRPLQKTPTPIVTAKPTRTAFPSATVKPIVTQAPILTQKPPVTTLPPMSNADYTTLSLAKQEEIVFTLLNQDRAAYGLPALVLDKELSRIARIKCEDMRDNHYFAHESPTYGRAAQMLTHFGYAYNGCGENIAHHATVQKAQAAFISSPAHRINVMGKQWLKVGIGVCYDENGFVYVTQIFAR